MIPANYQFKISFPITTLIFLPPYIETQTAE